VKYTIPYKYNGYGQHLCRGRNITENLKGVRGGGIMPPKLFRVNLLPLLAAWGKGGKRISLPPVLSALLL